MSDDDPFGLLSDAGRTRVRPVSPGSAPQDGRTVVQAPPAARPPAWPEAAVPARPRPEPSWPEPFRSVDPYARAAPRQESGWGGQGAQGGASSPFGGGAAGAQSGAAGAPPRHDRAHPNPLIAAFAPLLALAPELERAQPPGNPAALRVRLRDGLEQGTNAAVALGASSTRAAQGAWFVAALLDDLAINTPWGGHSDWPAQSLVVSLSGEVDAGTKFFDRLADLQANSARDPELLELASTCLALGFRGRHRLGGPGGEAALAQARSASARLLPRDATRALSPHWEGVNAPNWRRRIGVPAWAVMLFAAVAVAGVHVALGARLAREGEALAVQAGHLPPDTRAPLVRVVRESGGPVTPGEPPPAPEPLPAPVTVSLLPDFEAAAPEPLRGALAGQEDVSLVTLTVRGSDPSLFRSARADLDEAYAPLVAAIAARVLANRDVIARVTVVGHTDSDPVSLSNPFQSNQGLSEARARAFAEALVAAGVPADLVASEGRGATEPVADNGTPEGQAQNRRVEVRIEKVL